MIYEDTLRIKNLPRDLSDSEKEEFLSHFGAIQVKVITSKIKGKSVAFAKFESKEIAKNVMFRLHQVTILNCRLCVEYAEQDIGYSDSKLPKAEKKDENVKYFRTFINKLNAFNSHVSFQQPPPPHLKYVYPQPNRATINNIAHALASIPKFYTQVLHLMNKMNLPPPFSNIPDVPATNLRENLKPIFAPNIPATTENKKSSSESELESDPEEINKNSDAVPVKRKLQQKKTVKRPKFIKPPVLQTTTNTKIAEKPEDVFEQVNLVQHKIELKLTTESLDSIQQKEDVNSEETGATKSDVIPEDELNKNRIPLDDLRVLPVFKDYHPGVPTSKLYIKNISKAVEVKDLEYIYKRYMGTVEENEENLFNIRLMQEGRMKGQAFVTFNNVELAQQALKETNGFVVKDKPLVVVFAKSNVSK